MSIAVARLAEIYRDDVHGLAWRCFIKHYCVCVLGEDMTPTLPACRPSAALVAGMTADTFPVIEKLRHTVGRTEDLEPLARSAARKLLLTCAAIVSLSTGDWTTDRYRAAAHLAARHPDQALYLDRAAAWAQPNAHGTVDAGDLLLFIDGFGSWVRGTLAQVLEEAQTSQGPS